MKTDSIFYRLFQELPAIFFELIGNPPEIANIYQFASVEIKQTPLELMVYFSPPKMKQARFILLKFNFNQTQIFTYA